MKPRVALRKALSDKGLMGHVLAGPSWATWRILLIAAVGEALTDDERVVFEKITGRSHEPGQCISELEAIVGRRGGKTRALAALATYISGLCDHSDVLAPGEDGVLLCLAQDQRVAKKILDFCEEDFDRSPILQQLVVGRTQDALELKRGIRIEVRPASFRRLRGPTYVACICDEVAFWYTEDNYVNPDVEVLAAIKPGLLTTHGPLVIASSPYAKRGVLWTNYRKHYGAAGSPSVLVAKGTTIDFNPTIDPAEIERLLEEDRPRNTAEYLAEFRSDLEAYVQLEAVEACIATNVFERGPLRNIAYAAFVDPSGGSADSFTLAVAHLERSRETVVLDCLREIRAPFSPEAAVADFAAVLKSYHLASATGDKYGGLWVKEQAARYGISYRAEAEPKSILYASLLAAINSRRVDLLDNPRLLGQLVGLERRVGRSGRDTIDHPPNGHDDVANACAGVVATILAKGVPLNYAGMNGTDEDDPAKSFRAARLAGYINSFNPNFNRGGRWG